MGREEQIEERQVLESIFPDEITDISENEFRIAIKLDLDDDHDHDPGDNEDEDDNSHSPTILLQISLPELYPDVPPLLSLHPILSSSGQPLQHPLLHLPTDAPHLLSPLDAVITDNIGIAMLFNIISTLKESAEQLISERRAVQEDLKENEARKKEEEENRRFVGERVTKESFLRWREGFRREIKEREERKRVEEEEREGRGPGGNSVGRKDGGMAGTVGTKREEQRKLTGRELWEKGLVGKVEEDNLDDEKETQVEVEGVMLEKLKITDAS